MRRVRCFLMALSGLLLVTASVSSQSMEKQPSFPTEIAGKSMEKWIDDIRDKDDLTNRQVAIQTVPHFGPTAAREACRR